MATDGVNRDEPRKARRRLIAWCAFVGGLLLLPAVAMQFTTEVNWDETDFIAASALLLGLAVPIEFALRKGRSLSYKLAAALTVIACFLLTWSNLAVGVIGNEDNPLNLLFFGVVLFGLVGSIVVRFRAAGMAWVVGGMAAAQVLIALFVLSFGWGGSEPPGLIRLAMLIAFFAGAWGFSALLFRKAAQG